MAKNKSKSPQNDKIQVFLVEDENDLLQENEFDDMSNKSLLKMVSSMNEKVDGYQYFFVRLYSRTTARGITEQQSKNETGQRSAK